MDCQGASSSSRSMNWEDPNSFSALWWFGRRIRARNHIRRPIYPERNDHIRQPFSIPICDMLWAHTVHACKLRYDVIHSDGGDSGSNGVVAIGCGQSWEMASSTLWAECPTREISFHRRTPNVMGRKACPAGCYITRCSFSCLHHFENFLAPALYLGSPPSYLNFSWRFWQRYRG